MKNKFQLPLGLRSLLYPLLSLVILATLFLFGLKTAVSEIGLLRSQLNEVRKNVNILQEKESLLATLRNDILSQTNSAAAALPSADSSLPAIAQLKSSALLNGIILANLKVGGGSKEKNGLVKTNLSFGIQGPLVQTIAFLSSIKNVAPIMNLEAVEINLLAGTANAKITAGSYWAPFPIKLPALTQPVTVISAEEKKVLEKVENLLPPAFINLSAGFPNEAVNPFGQ